MRSRSSAGRRRRGKCRGVIVAAQAVPQIHGLVEKKREGARPITAGANLI